MFLHRGFYDQAKNKGIEIIKNEALRKQIGRLYEFHYPNILDKENRHPDYQFATILAPKLYKFLSFNQSGEVSSLNPTDYFELIKDKKLQFELYIIGSRRKGQVENYYLPLIKNVNGVMKLISKEILLLEK